MTDPYRVALVCLGNICRSPMAHVVLEDRLAKAGLAGRVAVTSSGTGDWHVGQRMDKRAAARLSAAGYDPTHHRARQITAADLTNNDLVLAMDAANLSDLNRMASPGALLQLFRDFDPEAGPGAEVPDPWWGGTEGFDEVLEMVERTADALVAHLRDTLSAEERKSPR